MCHPTVVQIQTTIEKPAQIFDRNSKTSGQKKGGHKQRADLSRVLYSSVLEKLGYFTQKYKKVFTLLLPNNRYVKIVQVSKVFDLSTS